MIISRHDNQLPQAQVCQQVNLARVEAKAKTEEHLIEEILKAAGLEALD